MRVEFSSSFNLVTTDDRILTSAACCVRIQSISGLLAIVNSPQVARTCILRALGFLQMSCRLSLVLRLLCFVSPFVVFLLSLKPRSFVESFFVLRSSICMRPDSHIMYVFFMESTRNVFPFRMVFIYLVTTTYSCFFLTQAYLLRENEISQLFSGDSPHFVLIIDSILPCGLKATLSTGIYRSYRQLVVLADLSGVSFLPCIIASRGARARATTTRCAEPTTGS